MTERQPSPYERIIRIVSPEVFEELILNKDLREHHGGHDPKFVYYPIAQRRVEAAYGPNPDVNIVNAVYLEELRAAATFELISGVRGGGRIEAADSESVSDFFRQRIDELLPPLELE